jgi:hypothetical protein
MPILVEITYEDDTVDNFKYPAQIWKEKAYSICYWKAIKKIQIDPD